MKNYETSGNYDRVFNSRANDVRLFEVQTKSFDDINLNNTKAGKPIIDALKRHTLEILKQLSFEKFVLGRDVLVVGIPRGGVPSAESVSSYIQATGASSLALKFSNIKSNRDKLFSDEIDFGSFNFLVLVDAVVATGKTIIDHLDQIPAEFSGDVFLISNASAEIGAKNLQKALIDRNLKGVFVTGGIIPDDRCVFKEVDGKKVLIVGLGDMGEAVSHNKTRYRDFTP